MNYRESIYLKTIQTQLNFDGKLLDITICTRAFDEKEPYDGDNEADIEAYNNGDFKMIGICVTAIFMGVEGTDSLGMTCYKSDDDIVSTIAEYGMVQNALNDLKQNLTALKSALKG